MYYKHFFPSFLSLSTYASTCPFPNTIHPTEPPHLPYNDLTNQHFLNLHLYPCPSPPSLKVMTHNLESLPLLEGVGSSWGLASLGVNDKNPGSCRVRAATEAVVVYQLMHEMRRQLKEIGMLQAFVSEGNFRGV